MSEYSEATLSLPLKYLTAEIKTLAQNDSQEYVNVTSNVADGTCSIMSSLATDGYFSKAEAFLVKKKIPFDRYSGPREMGPPFVQYYRPDEHEAFKVFPSDRDGQHYIPEQAFTELMNSIFEGSLSREETLDEMSKLLRQHTPLDVTKLSCYGLSS